MITLGYSRQSMPSALKIAEASGGRIEAVRRGGQINWGRRRSTGALLNPDNTNAVNKRLMRQLFVEHGVPSPEVFCPGAALVAAENGTKLIGRPDFHTRCRGLWLCESPAEVNNALNVRRNAATHFMEFIPLEQEFRVHVFQGKSIRISEKKPIEEGPLTYTTIKPTLTKKKHIRQAAKQAVAALGLDFGVVDILADNETAYVLEVNTAPGLGGSTPRLWAETFINWNEGREE